MTKYTCPVCGYPNLSELPWSEEEGGSYEICASCGFEFGYTDEDQGYSYESWRARWIANGMQWRSRGIAPPPGWDPQRQLNDLLGTNGGLS